MSLVGKLKRAADDNLPVRFLDRRRNLGLFTRFELADARREKVDHAPLHLDAGQVLQGPARDLASLPPHALAELSQERVLLPLEHSLPILLFLLDLLMRFLQQLLAARFDLLADSG